MATFKVVFIFGLGKQGWTETHYYTAALDPNSLSLKQQLKDEAVFRDRVLGRFGTIEAIRYSDVLTPRLARLVDESDTAGGISGQIGSDAVRCDQAGAAVYLTARTQTGERRTIWLRGIPDSWIERNLISGQMNLTGDGFKQVQRYTRHYTAGGRYQMKLRKKAGAVDDGTHTVSHDIVNISLNSDPAQPVYKIQTRENNAWGVGDRIVLSGARGQNVGRAMGVHKVLSAPTLDTVLIDAQPNPIPPTIFYSGGGKGRKLDYYYASITEVTIGRVAFRKTGRALFVPRGRRRVLR